MALQTEVAFDFEPAIAGLVHGPTPNTNDRVAEEEIQAGLFVCQGAEDGTCALPASSGDLAKGLGVAPSRVTSDSRFPSTSTPGVTYQEGDTVGAVNRGKIWVQVEEAVDAGDEAFVRFAAGAGGTQLGAFRKSADTATAAAIVARYRTSAAEDGLALLEINIP